MLGTHKKLHLKIYLKIKRNSSDHDSSKKLYFENTTFSAILKIYKILQKNKNITLVLAKYNIS